MNTNYICRSIEKYVDMCHYICLAALIKVVGSTFDVDACMHLDVLYRSKPHAEARKQQCGHRRHAVPQGALAPPRRLLGVRVNRLKLTTPSTSVCSARRLARSPSEYPNTGTKRDVPLRPYPPLNQTQSYTPSFPSRGGSLRL
jgi:hypothetical protein